MRTYYKTIWYFICIGIITSLIGCATTEPTITVKRQQGEREKILTLMSLDDKYLLMAFEKQGIPMPFFEISSYLYDYRNTTNDKTIEGFLSHLRNDLIGYTKFEDGTCIQKFGWTETAADKYIEKIRKDYEFIRDYEERK